MKQSKLNEYLQAFDHFFPEGVLFKVDTPIFDWPNKKAFEVDVKTNTPTHIDISSGNRNLIKNAQIELAKLVEIEKENNSVSPEEAVRAQQEAERVVRAEAKKQADEKSKIEVETTIQRQKEVSAKLKTSLENKKIYYKAEEIAPELKKQAETDPKQFIEDTAKQFANNPGLKDMSPENIQLISKQAAITTYETVVGNSPLVQAEIINKIITDPQYQGSLKDIGEVLIEQKTTQYELARQFLNLPQNIKIEFSDTPQPGFKEFDLSQIPSEYTQNLNDQLEFLNGARGFGLEEIKSRILLTAGSKINIYIAKLPVDSLLAKTYNSEIVQLGLQSLGLVQAAPWVAVEGSFIGNVAISSGLGNVIGAIQTKTGIDFGIKLAVKAGVETVVKTGTEVAVEGGTGIGLAATITAAFAWTGPLAPVIGVVGAFLVTIVGTEVVKKVGGLIKDNIQKYGKYVVYAVGGVFGFILGGVGGAVVGTGITILGMAGLTGGTAAISTAASGIASTSLAALGFVWETALAGIGAPILATLIGFPLVVALILFIINSGAYIVPPGASQISSTNAYISVEKTSSVSGKAPSPTSVIYTVTITAKKDTLTGISISNDCKATKKGVSAIDCKSLEKMPAPADIPTQITPGSPFTFTFTSNYDSKYQDSLVADNINVSATSTSGGKVSEIGSASVCFGDCPLDCFAFPEAYWPKGNSDVEKLKSLLTGAIGTLAGEYPNFATKVCAGGTVNLCYKPSILPKPSIFAWHEHGYCDIDFGSQVAPYGPEGVLFLLTHEVTHHIQKINPGSFTKFMDKVNPPQSEGYICTRGADDPYESMAEANALFVAKPVIDAARSCLTTSFQSQYPRHYNFAKNVMFAP